MRIPKLVLTLLVIVLLFSCDTKNEPATKKIIVTKPDPVTLMAQLDSMKTGKEGKMLFVHAILFNNSTDTFKYYAMTCSWPEAFTTDSKALAIQNNICFSNWYVTKSIPPFKSNDYFLTIAVKDTVKENNFKIGFNLTPYFIPKDDEQVFQALTDMKRLIWSYPVQFPNKKTGS